MSAGSDQPFDQSSGGTSTTSSNTTPRSPVATNNGSGGQRFEAVASVWSGRPGSDGVFDLSRFERDVHSALDIARF